MIDYDTTPVEYVSTHRLKEGDLVRHHGVVFRLKDRKERVEKDDPNTPVVWFKTELVHEPEDHHIPRHWLKDWVIQGNHLATWGSHRSGRGPQWLICSHRLPSGPSIRSS